MKYRIYLLCLAFICSSCEEEQIPEPFERTSSTGLILESEEEYDQIPECTIPDLIFKTQRPPSWMLNTPPAVDQGCMNACTGFSAGYGIMSFYVANELGNFQYTEDVLRSPSFLFNQATLNVLSACQGAYFTSSQAIFKPGVLNILKNQGICSWSEMPYETPRKYKDSNGSEICPLNCSIQPSEDQKDQAESYRIKKFEKIKNRKDDEDYLKGLLLQGYPILFGLTVHEGFSIYNDETKKSEILSETNHTGAEIGEHAMVIKGYDDTKNAYRVLNSWGQNFGEQGEFWFDYDYFGDIASRVYVLHYEGSSGIKIISHEVEWQYPLNNSSCISDMDGSTFDASAYTITLSYAKSTFNPNMDEFELNIETTTSAGTINKVYSSNDSNLKMDIINGTFRLDRCHKFSGTFYFDVKYWITTNDGLFSNVYSFRVYAPNGAEKGMEVSTSGAVN